MPLFSGKKKTKEAGGPPPTLSYAQGDQDLVPNDAPEHLPNGLAGGPFSSRHAAHRSQQERGQYKHGAHVSKSQLDIGGLPVNVFGMEELTPVFSRASAPPPPPVAVIIHMHGRTGSANNEEDIVRHLYDRIERCKRRAASQIERAGQQAPVQKDHLLISFDARNHGHRKTNPLGQKSWKEENKAHAMDLYAMVVGTARDLSFLIDFLPAYLFPHDERAVTQWIATGKSLGGHSTWHVLANEPRVTVAVPYIGMPDYLKLLARRTQNSFVPNAPPIVPNTLRQLVQRIDPAQRKGFDAYDANINPFFGKKILVCAGAEDRLVKWEYSEEFLQRLVVEYQEANVPNQNAGLRIFMDQNAGHTVTERMVEEAGEWIFQWAVFHS